MLEADLKLFFKQFSETFLEVREKQPYAAMSCSAFDDRRSAYEQLVQLPLFPDSLSDAEIIEQILPRTAPRQISSRNHIGDPYSPHNQIFFVSRHALNGWCPQNHMDCAAGALSGAINTALGFKRGEFAFVTTVDIVDVMKLRAEYRLDMLLNTLSGSVDIEDLKTGIEACLHTEEQTEAERDKRLDPPKFSILLDKVLAYRKDKEQNLDEVQLFLFEHLINTIKIMKAIEIRAGYQEFDEVIKDIGFPIKLSVKYTYTWRELKTLLLDPTIAVTVHIPAHACLLFAMAEDEGSSKHRHVLIGSAAGGQNPCSWIPYTERDAYPDKTYWKSTFGNTLVMKKSKKQFLLVKIFRRTCEDSITFNPPPQYAAFNRPWYVKSKEMFCDSCAIHSGTGDATEFPKRRAQWFNSP